MHDSASATVFTTPERYDLIRAGVGDEADYRMNPYETLPLELVLSNIAIGGGTLVVIDESHLFSMEDLDRALRHCLDDAALHAKSPRIILISSERSAGDPWLAYFAGHYGIYDILYGCQGVDVTLGLLHLIEHPNTRFDVLELLPTHEAQRVLPAEAPLASVQEICREVQDGLKIKLLIQIEPIDAN